MHEQDLQSGNLAGAQSDFAAFLHNISAGTQSNCANPVLTSGNSTVAQALAALGNDLQSGNLQGAHEDSTNLQQELTQISSRQVRGHHGYHRHQAGEFSVFLALFATDESDRPGIQQAGTRFATRNSILGAVRLFSVRKRSSRNQRFPDRGIGGASSTAVPSSIGNLNATA